MSLRFKFRASTPSVEVILPSYIPRNKNKQNENQQTKACGHVEKLTSIRKLNANDRTGLFHQSMGMKIKLFQAGSCRLNDRHLHEKLSRPHSKRKTSTTCTGPTAINGQARKGIASRSTCMSSMLPTLTAELEVAY